MIVAAISLVIASFLIFLTYRKGATVDTGSRKKFLVTIAVLLFLGSTGYTIYSSIKHFAPPISSTNKWLHFADSSSPYEFNYPPEFKIQNTGSKSIILTSTNKNDSSEIGINPFVEQDLAIQDYNQLIQAREKDDHRTTHKNYMVNGMKVTSLFGHSNDGAYINNLLQTTDSKFYEVITTGPDNQGTIDLNNNFISSLKIKD